MKIDLVYELEMPKPWGPDTEYNIYWEAMEQIEAADRYGFDTVWEVEHHFLEEYSHSSAPEVFLAAVAQRTHNIRIGHGVVLLPPEFNHPIRVAERVAALDIMSKGRLEFGTGRSSAYEQMGFGIDPTLSREMWQEAVRIIPQMWMQEKFSYQGRFVKIPERAIVPKPYQKPHPPMWLACTGIESWEIAGQNGLGCLGLTIWVDLPEVQQRMVRYRKALEGCRPAGAFINSKVATFTIAHCAESLQTALEHNAPDCAMFHVMKTVRALAATPKELLGKIPGSLPYQDLLKQFPALKRYEENGRLSFDEINEQDMIIVGDPDQCVQKLKRYEAAGVDHVLCLMQVGALKHEYIMKSIELFGKYVIPEFHNGKSSVSTTGAETGDNPQRAKPG
jgi:alkanesulfonate monooxygenase SsuD/methylene tetrahydromethanopterin reductase-like flavin-dependent oxidoreductase (luciferase family)